MSTHNICFHGEITKKKKKIITFSVEQKHLIWNYKKMELCNLYWVLNLKAKNLFDNISFTLNAGYW